MFSSMRAAGSGPRRVGDQATYRMALTAIWDLPFGKGARFLNNVPGAVNHIIGGWKLYWVSNIGNEAAPGC